MEWTHPSYFGMVLATRVHHIKEEGAMAIVTLGIDLAKSVFHVHGRDAAGRPVFQKRFSRAALMKFMANLPVCRVGMEVCGGANYWSRTFQAFGHDVRLISPQFVKPYVKTNKNDFNDAEAICEAVLRPTMRFVTPKTIAQQDLQNVHRVRRRLIGARTALVNQMRGLLIRSDCAQASWALTACLSQTYRGLDQRSHAPRSYDFCGAV
jgi:transposase